MEEEDGEQEIDMFVRTLLIFIFTLYSASAFSCDEEGFKNCLKYNNGGFACYKKHSCDPKKFVNEFCNSFDYKHCLKWKGGVMCDQKKKQCEELVSKKEEHPLPKIEEAVVQLSAEKALEGMTVAKEVGFLPAIKCLDKIKPSAPKDKPKKKKLHNNRIVYTTGAAGASRALPINSVTSINQLKPHHSWRSCRLKKSNTCKSFDLNIMRENQNITMNNYTDLFGAKVRAPRAFKVLTAKQATKPGGFTGLNDVFIEDVETGAVMQIIHNSSIPKEITNAAGTGKVFPGGTVVALQGDHGCPGAYHVDVQATSDQYILDFINANSSGIYETK